jgi:hypothetical protein
MSRSDVAVGTDMVWWGLPGAVLGCSGAEERKRRRGQETRTENRAEVEEQAY